MTIGWFAGFSLNSLRVKDEAERTYFGFHESLTSGWCVCGGRHMPYHVEVVWSKPCASVHNVRF
jgi:hypothetical protein